MTKTLLGLACLACIGCESFTAPTQPRLKSVATCVTKLDTIPNLLPTGPRTMVVEHRCP